MCLKRVWVFFYKIYIFSPAPSKHELEIVVITCLTIGVEQIFFNFRVLETWYQH